MSEEDDVVLAGAISAVASQIGLVVPEMCAPGVLANTRILRRFAALVEGIELPDTIEPAFEYHP